MDTSSRIPQFDVSFPFALLENSRAQQGEEASMLFWGAVQHITAHDEESLQLAFAQLESHRQAGHFLCGYMTYEAGYLLADKKGLGLSKLQEGALPLLSFFAFSHCERLNRQQVDEWLRSVEQSAPCAIHGLELEETESNYCAKIERIRRYIREGDTYQVNYTLKYRFDFEGKPLGLYRELRERQTVEYGSYLNFPEARVVSLSPELFIRKDGERLMSKPMKGTAKRGATAQEDLAIVQALREDPKTISENVMIVDLLRNDIGRLAKAGSVRVRDLFEVQTFQTVHQMISTVEGTLASEVTIGEVFRQLFPCGSITGAPKLRTMEIIEQLEESPRGIYTGAIGYITPQNDFCFSVPIRTIVSREESRAELGIGSGIIHEAIATAEFSECLLKARFLTGLNEKFQLIESLRFSTQQATPNHLEQHLARLERSARHFGFTWDPARVHAAVHHATERAAPGDYKLRLLLHQDGRVLTALTRLAEESTGRRWLMLSSEFVNSESVFQYHKSTMRAHYERASQEAASVGAYDVLFLNERGELAETARHNLFIEKDGELLTPPLSAGILNGVQRGLLLADPARKARETPLTLVDLVQADRIFLTNSVRGVVEVELLPALRANLLKEGKIACSA